MLNQDEVREKYKKRMEREKQSYISRKLKIPQSLLSSFKNGDRNLWAKDLERLNDYLDATEVQWQP